MSQSTPRLRIIDDFWRQLSAVDAVRDHRARRAVRRRRALRTLAIAMLVLLGLAAVALAARAIVFGEAAERAFTIQGPGAPAAPDGSRLLGPRVPDPDGGPPWAIRTFQPVQGDLLACVQVGRIVDEQLVALGINGAFHDDGRAHRLPVEAVGCGNAAARAAVPVDVRDSSGAPAGQRCLDAETRAQNELNLLANVRYVDRLRRSGPRSELDQALGKLAEARKAVTDPPVPCETSALRSVFAGFAGPAGGTVTLTEASGRQHVAVAPSADDGPYLFVLAGQLHLSAVRLTVRYPNGRTCVLSNPYAFETPPPGTDRSADTIACLSAAGYELTTAKPR